MKRLTSALRLVAIALPALVAISTGLAQDIDETEKARLIHAAERGNAQAQFELGARYRGGREGFERNSTEAVRWYRRGRRPLPVPPACARRHVPGRHRRSEELRGRLQVVRHRSALAPEPPALRACLRGVEHLGHGGRETGEQGRGSLAATGVHAVLGVAVRAELEHGDGLVAGIDDPSTPECPPRRSRSSCRPDPVPGDPG